MFKNLLQSKLITAGLVLLIGFFLLSIIKLQPALIAARKEIKNIDQKISEIERARQEAEKLGEYLNSPAYLEKQARIKLNYKKPDEKVVYIYNKTPESRNGTENAEIGIAEKIISNKFYKNLKSWWRYLVE